MPFMCAVLIHLGVHTIVGRIISVHFLEPVRNASLSSGKNTPGEDASRTWSTARASSRTVPVHYSVYESEPTVVAPHTLEEQHYGET